MPLKIAVMSLAHVHALSYIPLLQTYDDVEVRTSDPGPHDPGEVRGRDLANQLGVAYEDSYDALLRWEPDGVIITSDNSGHRMLAEAAAAAGAAILCEKPIATNLEDAVAMRSSAESAGVPLMIALPVRQASAFQAARTAFAEGRLGQILAVHGSNNSQLPRERAWFTDPTRSGGGALVDHIVHIADLIDDLTHAAPQSVTAVTNRILHADRAQVETGALVTISYDTGLIAAIDCSWSQPDTAQSWGGLAIDLDGTEGSVSLDLFGPRVVGLQTPTGLPLELPYGQDYNDAMLRAFLRTIGSGAPPQPGADAAIRGLQIVLAAQESAEMGTTVSIPSMGFSRSRTEDESRWK